jgi:hypothetical protein
MRRLFVALSATLLWLALLAPTALAGDNPTGGQGLYGETDDKVVTNAGFILIAGFPLLVAGLSLLQWRLEKRKHAREDAEKARRTRAEWTAGW